jgi:hypothetical protein
MLSVGGNNGVAVKSQMQIAGYSAATTYGLTIAPNDAYSTLPAAIVIFSAKYNSGGAYANFSAIIGGKENATDGNSAGYLSFLTEPNGSAFGEKMRISSTGLVGIGTSAPSELLQIGNYDLSSAGARRAITLGSGGYGAPAAANTNSNGDKLILYNTASGTATGDFRIGVGTIGDLWLKSSSVVSVWTPPTAGGAFSEVMRIGGGSAWLIGDGGGLAGAVGYTGSAVGHGVTACSITNSVGGSNAGFIKIYVGTTAMYIPYYGSN